MITLEDSIYSYLTEKFYRLPILLSLWPKITYSNYKQSWTLNFFSTNITSRKFFYTLLYTYSDIKTSELPAAEHTLLAVFTVSPINEN